jgi:hypothetical protein
VGAVIIARTSENIANSEELVRVIVNCGMRELVAMIQLILVTVYKNTINPITNQ